MYIVQKDADIASSTVGGVYHARIGYVQT